MWIVCIHVCCVCVLCVILCSRNTHFLSWMLFFFMLFHSLCWSHKSRAIVFKWLWLYTIVYGPSAHNGRHIIFVLFFLKFWILIRKKCTHNFFLLFCNSIITDCFHSFFPFYLRPVISAFRQITGWLLKFMSLKMIRTFQRKWYAIVTARG